MRYRHFASHWLTTPLGKVLFIGLGAIATVFFLPYAAVATFALAGCVLTCSQIDFNTISVFLLGPCGLLGLGGAWLRVMFPVQRFQASRKLRAVTAIFLSSGLIVSTVLLTVFLHDKKWGLVGVFAVSFLLGTFLLVATFGEVASEKSP